MDYSEFLQSKALTVPAAGKVIDKSLISEKLFDYQKDVVAWAARKGRAALFLDTGLGKTACQIEWARLMGERTLIIAPLSVARQTVKEAKKLLGVEVHYTRSAADLIDGLNITNYEMIEHFNPADFGAVVLDESSILKNLTGKMRTLLIRMFKDTRYRLCCTATPAPNDITEIANHAEFLGVMTYQEMLSVFFRYDSKDATDGWVLKKHASNEFYRWLASWSIAIKKPSDFGYDDSQHQLPPLHVEIKPVDTDWTPPGMLPGFYAGNISAIDARQVRRATISQRVDLTAAMVNASDEQWVIWCGLNEEAGALAKAIPGSVDVHGSMTPDEKADLLERYVNGEIRVLITKTSIAGFGLNMQQSRNMVFFGMDYSWESYYQAVRRMYRFGQQRPVNVYIVTSQQEMSIVETVMQKEKEATGMSDKLIEASMVYSIEELHSVAHNEWVYRKDESKGDMWTLKLGDSVERIKEIASNSVDMSIYSPPFTDIFVYSATPRDLGNSVTPDQFFKHYSYIIAENFRITKPGRLCYVHVADGRAIKAYDGYIGRHDFSGDVIEAYQKAGWIFWQRITIEKNPQAQAIRLKDNGLKFQTLENDSTRLYGGHPDYVLVFKKPGDNAVPVTPLKNGEMTRDDWAAWASGCWRDIRETNTLNVAIARSDEDAKHMCPLQLDLIERCLKMGTNPGELVFSPFAGVGSEGYEAVKHGRRFIGIELKPEYYEMACKNLREIERSNRQDSFFHLVEAANDK